MASAHIYPGTTTRLAAEVNALVNRMRQIDGDLPQIKAIMDQVAMGGDWVALAAEFGYQNAADAETEYNIIGSLLTELEAAPWWNQVIARRG